MEAPLISSKKSLDVLFVHPSFTNVYQALQEALAYPALEPPYRAALTAEYVQNRGYGAAILDTNVLGLSAEQAAAQAHAEHPRLVQIEVHGNQPSASSQLMDWVLAFTQALKSYNPAHRVLLTGTHPAALPERTLHEGAGDYVGRGDGFATTLELLQQTPLDRVPGIWYKEDGKVIRGARDTLMEPREMNETLKRAAWSLLPIEKYRAHDWHCLENLEQRQPYMSLYTSFGCPFGCSFCCINAPFTDGGERKSSIRCRDPKIVVSEIEEVARLHGVHPGKKLNIKIIDEMFVLNPKHYTGVANELIARGLHESINIWAYARVDTVREGHLDLLKKAGFNWLALGIESGSALVRDGVEKGRFGESDIARVVKSIQKAGIYIVGNYIFGLPDDTQETMQTTYDLAVALACERPNFYSAMAYPGSELHRMASQEKYPHPAQWDPTRPLLPEDVHKGGPSWIGYSQHGYSTLNLPTATLLPEEVLAFRDRTLVTYFTDPSYIGMIAQKFGDKTARDFSAMNAIVPRRKLLEERLH